MRIGLIGVALLGLIGLAVAAGAAEPERARIQLDCTLMEFSPEGQKKVISEPRLVTLDGQTASFFDGSELAFPVGTGPEKKLELVPIGFSFEVKPRLQKSRSIVVDVSVLDTQGEQTAEGSIRTRSTRVRSVETVHFGELLKVKLDKGQDKGSYVLEIRVRDADEAAGPSADRP